MNHIEQAFQREETPKYFVNKHDPRVPKEARLPKGEGLLPDVYEKILTETIIALSAEERKIFLQKHFFCYSDRNVQWFNQLKELIADVEFAKKDEFIETINQYLEELELVKTLDFNEKALYALRKLSGPDTEKVNIYALGKIEFSDVWGYLFSLDYITLYSMNYEFPDTRIAEIRPKGKSYLASVDAHLKPVLLTIENLQNQLKKLDKLQKDPRAFLDWCDETSRYLDLANEVAAINIIEYYKKDFDNIHVETFKTDMSERIMKIINFIKEYKRFRTPNTTIMNQENNFNNSGNMSIVNGHGNQVNQTNTVTNTKLSESELKKLIAETTEALKADLPNLKLDNDEVEELKKQIEELESLQAAPLTKKSGWKLGTIKDILKNAAGGALGDLITKHIDKVGVAYLALSQWFGQ